VPETFAILAQAQLASNTQASETAPASTNVATPQTVGSIVATPQPETAQGSTETQNQEDNVTTRIENQWLIQIGAYGQESAATERLDEAKTAAATILANGNAYTEQVVRNQKTLYRARFRGFDQTTAQNACRELKRANISCLPMRLE
jgi:D-alanyl-D-alanine carboxypeptidase